MNQYPHIFPPSQIDSALFYKFYAQVCTRCFGWGLPSTSMIPMADNCNHSDVTVVQEILNKPMHLEAERSSKYFTKTKFMNDYSINFQPSEYEHDADLTLNVKGRFSRENFEKNRRFTDLDAIKAALAGTNNNINGNGSVVDLWDVPCIREKYEEDNDTEEEGEDEDERQEACAQHKGQNTKKKGFKAFIETEKAMLRKQVQEAKA